MERFKCIIVDDDELDRLTVTSFVKRFPKFSIIGIFDNSKDALACLEKEEIDILFLDIDMPGDNGIALRKKADHVPVCIFITAHAEHAVESFQLETLDFIIKPLKFERFTRTVNRIEEFMEIREKASLYESSLGGDAIYIKEGHNQIKVKLHEIIYLEALKDYTLLVTEKKRHCVLSTLGNLLNTENFVSFIRVHRSFAVQKQRVKKISTSEIVMDSLAIVPVGRSFKDNLSLLV